MCIRDSNSSTEAVNCCVEIQKTTKDIQDLNLRVAIHQGEVVVQGEDIVGDDVNITSRIEKYAASGGIAISGRVNASLERDPAFSTLYLGSPVLKGVSQEVKIYSIISHNLPSLDPIIEKIPITNQKMKWNRYIKLLLELQIMHGSDLQVSSRSVVKGLKNSLISLFQDVL